MARLTKKDILEVFTMIQVEYPNEIGRLTDEEMKAKMRLWYAELAFYPAEDVFWATRKALASEKFAPKLSDIVTRIERRRELNAKSDIELWDELEGTFPRVLTLAPGLRYDNSMYEAQAAIEDVYESLDPDIRLFVTTSGDLIDLAEMDDEHLAIKKATFLKHIATLRAHRGEVAEKENPATQMGTTLFEAIADATLSGMPALGGDEKKIEDEKPVFELEDDDDDDGDGNDDD